jgi:S-layer homology domain.
MKKAISLLLALTLCVGLATTSLAAGETTVTASDGFVYTLSHGVLGTEQWTHNRDGFERLEEDVTHTVYLVPVGTVLTLPDGYDTGTVYTFELDHEMFPVRGGGITKESLPFRTDYDYYAFAVYTAAEEDIDIFNQLSSEVRSELVYFRCVDSVASEAPSSWAAESVNAAIAAGIVPDTLQAKYTTATMRAEFCHLAVALYESVTGEVITERTTFSDTTDINVEKMAALGVVQGTGNNQFSPDGTLTREQAATMLSRLADVLGETLSNQAPTFGDNGSISSWAYDAIGQMQASGIMSGVGNNAFAPAGEYTREQSIITMMRLYDLVK